MVRISSISFCKTTRSPGKQNLLALEERHSDDRLKGSVRYGRVIPLGNARLVEVAWYEEFYLDKKTAEQVTFQIEARMRRMLQDAGVVR
jgi:hypothetical protein